MNHSLLHDNRESLRRLASVLLLPSIIGLLALLAYWATLQPGLSGGDSAEAQFVPFTLSIMHYTGYPLYSVLGFAWSRVVAIGDVAYRMNLLSACAGAFAVAGLAGMVRLLSPHWLAGISGAILLATSTQFWDWSTKAGVRSLNVALIIAILALTVLWAHGQTDSTNAVNRRWISLWCVIGLSLAHHRTTILFLPGIAVYLLWVRPQLVRNWRAMFVALIAIVPGLLFYVYIPWRGANSPAYQPLPIDSLDHFLDLVLARNLSDLVTAITIQQVPQRLGWLADYLVGQFGLAGCCLAVAGLVLLAVRRPREGALIWVSLLLLVAFTIDYRIQGMAQLNVVFLLPVNALASLGVGYCMGSIRDLLLSLLARLHRLGRQYWTRWVANGAGIVATAIVAWPMATGSLAWVAPRSEPPLYAYREELRRSQAARLTASPESFTQPGSVIVGEWEHVAAFWYQQLVNGRWPGTTFRYPVDESLGIYIDQAWREGREIYVTRAVPGLGAGRYLSMAGPLIHILRQPETDPPQAAIKVKQSFEDGLGLAGYYVFTETLRPGGVLPVALYWRTDAQPRTDYSVSVRLLGPTGNQVAQEDAEQPVLGSYPTSHWPANAIIGDYYELRLPLDLHSGNYSLALVVYQRNADGSAHNLRNRVTGEELTRFGNISIVAAP